MRLFVAVDPPAGVIADLAAFTEPLRSSTAGVRWSDPALWHLTLTFCGEVPEAVADQLRERLGRVAHRHPSFPLRLVGAGAFARPARAHAVWIGLGGDTAALSRLAASTCAAARRCGIAVDERRFRPHLTVARRSPAGDVRALVEQLSSYEGEEWTVADLHLVRSHLGPRTVHERAVSWSLGERYQA